MDKLPVSVLLRRDVPEQTNLIISNPRKLKKNVVVVITRASDRREKKQGVGDSATPQSVMIDPGDKSEESTQLQANKLRRLMTYQEVASTRNFFCAREEVKQTHRQKRENRHKYQE